MQIIIQQQNMLNIKQVEKVNGKVEKLKFIKDSLYDIPQKFA